MNSQELEGVKLLKSKIVDTRETAAGFLTTSCFNSRPKDPAKPTIADLRYGCYRDFQGKYVLPVSNYQFPGLKAKTDKNVLDLDIIGWNDPTLGPVKAAVNFRIPITGKGGTDPNPPYGDPPYPFLPTELMTDDTWLRLLPIFIPQVVVTKGTWQGQVLDLIVPIIKEADGKWRHADFNATDTEEIKFDVVQFKDSSGNMQRIAVSPSK